MQFAHVGVERLTEGFDVAFGFCADEETIIIEARHPRAVSYTHLTLPTNREV